jgi:hypothetical protein
VGGKANGGYWKMSLPRPVLRSLGCSLLLAFLYW